MRTSGYLLLAVAAAACLATVQPLPTEHLEQTSADVQQTVPRSSTGWGLASFDALAQRINDWVAPVRRVIAEAVQNKTVSEVAIEARNATVNLASRVQETDVFQGVKEAITPLTRIFTQVRDNVKDKTLQELAGDVQRQIQQLDRSVAEFIRGLGVDEEDQETVDHVVPAYTGAEAQPEPEKAEETTAFDEAVDADNELEP